MIMSLSLRTSVFLVNIYTAKPLKKYLSAKHLYWLIDYVFILLFTYKIIFKISACYMSLERVFVDDYSALSLIKLLPLNILL